MNLVKRGNAVGIKKNIIARIATSTNISDDEKNHSALLIHDLNILKEKDLSNFALIITGANVENNSLGSYPIIHSVQGAEELCAGDIVSIQANSNKFRILFRINSKNNVIFTTDACNSNCLMCSQPPKEVDPNSNVEQIFKLISLIDPKTEAIGITGGEPLLLGENLFKIINECKTRFPQMKVHMLSNGRLFKDIERVKKYAEVDHPHMTVGVPLYSDVDSIHNYVVQAENAFSETMTGLHNLGQYRRNIEVRVVLHKQTYERLPQLARFIHRNLPFVNHIALMGLEIVGYVKANFDDLWIDPHDYQDKLSNAALYLAKNNMNVSVYNHQLCVLDKKLWKFARASISDWKNAYADECSKCDVRSLCGGFFQWNPTVRSSHIKAINLG
jgi:His-Xaa-Ser system radical SAM maturase HxsC